MVHLNVVGEVSESKRNRRILEEARGIPGIPLSLSFLLSQLKGQLPSTPLQIHLLFDFSHPPALGYCISAYLRVQSIVYNRTPVFGLDFLEIHSV